jgi:hypothetical protein
MYVTTAFVPIQYRRQFAPPLQDTVLAGNGMVVTALRRSGFDSGD